MDSDAPQIRESISLATVRELAQRGFGDMVKASVDIGRGVMRAFDRALELFDPTAADGRWPLHRRREILRAREQFCRVFYDETAEPDLASYLSKCFLQFAVAARRRAPSPDVVP